MSKTILFLCPHNAAKSVFAQAYCQQLTADKNLRFEVSSAGTQPDEVVGPLIAEMLLDEGIDVRSHKPRLVNAAEIANAFKVISIGCDIDALISSTNNVEYWNEIPPPSADLQLSRNLIFKRVEKLVNELQS